MKAFFARFSRRTWIIIGVVAVILLAVVFANSGGEPVSPYQTSPAERGDLQAFVGATGTVRAKQSATLIWQTTGIIQSVNAEIGDVVTKDFVLASLDKASLNQSIILAEADLVNAQKDLDNLLNSDTALLEAQQAVDKAEKAYEKAYNWRMQLNGKIDIKEYVYDQFGNLKLKEYRGYAGQATIDQADKDLALAESRLNDARREYERLLKGEESEEVAAAKARVEAAKATLNQMYLIAPFNGTITQASLVAGDQVTAGTNGFRIDDISSLLVDVQVSEVDINDVAVGQDAELTFDAILNKTYNGKVVQVGQAGETVQGVVSFTVTVELTDADELVKPGMTTAVNVVVEEVQDVLLIPNRAVRLIDGKRVVYVLRDNQPLPITVTLGASSDNFSVLASGDINEGDLIILNPPAQFGGPFGGG
ncbi:MAG: efflux RND transporter periplasmic adaptor subunit [Anaerolineales bacterium]|nr:efflux RND transporter periplasmic adaptor subunit [Anaerolineales bacterium]MBX3037677.1 efflux RND transporter periplasmic adaptor subunit [Anaerolineales bacterium]